MKPLTVRNNALQDVISKSPTDSVFTDSSDQTRCDVRVTTGHKTFGLELENETLINSDKIENRAVDLIVDKVECSEEMIYKIKKRYEENSACASRDNNVNGVNGNGFAALKTPGSEANVAAKQNNKLTEIVKEITEKKRQITNQCFDNNSTFRCRFSINGVPAASQRNCSLVADSTLSNKSLTKTKIKGNRRKQKPQKATPTGVEPSLDASPG